MTCDACLCKRICLNAFICYENDAEKCPYFMDKLNFVKLNCKTYTELAFAVALLGSQNLITQEETDRIFDELYKREKTAIVESNLIKDEVEE